LRIQYSTFEAFTTVKIQIEVFWIVTPGSVAVGYMCFGGLCCLHLPSHTMSRSRRPGLQSSLQWKLQLSYEGTC